MRTEIIRHGDNGETLERNSVGAAEPCQVGQNGETKIQPCKINTNVETICQGKHKTICKYAELSLYNHCNLYLNGSSLCDLIINI